MKQFVLMNLVFLFLFAGCHSTAEKEDNQKLSKEQNKPINEKGSEFVHIAVGGIT